MKFVLMPSLEHLALVQIGISFWNQNNVWALISKLNYRNLNPSKWEEIEERVKLKVPQLSIPELLKEKVFGVTKPIGKEIFEWMQYYREYDAYVEFHCLDLDIPAYLPAKLCWTPQGTVDRKRTAEVLLRDENLNVSRRYRLACDYCLEDDVIRFWNRLPEVIKDYDWSNFPVIRFWSDNMKTGRAGNISYKHVFYPSAFSCNKVASKYFLQKLTPQEREECLKDFAEHTKDAGVLFFLLSEIEEEEQKKIIKKSPHRVLQYFLQWPWQSFFIGVANCMWDFLSADNYDEVLGDIISKVRKGYEDYNYQNLFEEFWQKSPKALKDSLIQEVNKSWLLRCLFDIKDKENIRLILKDATVAAKSKLIYSVQNYNYLTRFVWVNEWDFLGFFIRECLPSKNEMLKFKENFEMRMMHHSYLKEYFETKKQEWDQLFHISDVSICKYNKSSLEERESSSSKQFQSLP